MIIGSRPHVTSSGFRGSSGSAARDADVFEPSASSRELSRKDLQNAVAFPRTVKLDEVVSDGAGGCNTLGAVARIGGKKKFLKSNAGSFHAGSRYANWESDILVNGMAKRLGLRSPQCEIVKLAADEPLRERLGDTVLAMEFVDSDFTSGKIRPGHYRGPENSNVDKFLTMFLLDLMIGNADRRGANYFIVEKAGGWEPILIDNNAAFGTMQLWPNPNNHCNFVRSYDGAGSGDVLKDMGTVQGTIQDTWDYPGLLDDPANRNRLLELLPAVQSALDDHFLHDVVGGLPIEVLPPDLKVDAVHPEFYKHLSNDQVDLLTSGQPQAMTREEYWAFRQADLVETMQWRRDHLGDALTTHFAKSPVAAG